MKKNNNIVRLVPFVITFLNFLFGKEKPPSKKGEFIKIYGDIFPN